MNLPSNRPLRGIDPEHLAAAMRLGSDPDYGTPDPTSEDLSRIARSGPTDFEEAMNVLASNPARQLLTVMWRSRCPAPGLLDAAVPGPDSDEDAEYRAKGLELLLTGLHTRHCPVCRERLQQLQNALAGFDPDTLAQELLVLEAWRLELLPGGAAVRGGSGQDAALTAELPDVEQFRTLVGRDRLEWERLPRITAAPDHEEPRELRVTLVLPAPAAAQVDHVVAVLDTDNAAVEVPLRFVDEERLLLQGACDLAAPPPASGLTVGVRAVLCKPAPGPGDEPA